MSGTCQICGCTEDHACDDGGEPCCWIDQQRDLCSRCGRELFTRAIDGGHEALLLMRVLRAAHLETVERLGELENFARHIAGNLTAELRAERASPGPIWTPDQEDVPGDWFPRHTGGQP